MTYEITHTSGDVAEAETSAGAGLAARTLIEDNEGGSCRITEYGQPYDTVGLRGGAFTHTRPARKDF